MKAARVYKRQGQLLVGTLSQTDMGLWISDAAYARLPADAQDEDIAAAVDHALSCSQQQVPHPTDFRGATTLMLQSAGVKSWRTFIRGAQLVSIRAESGRQLMIPTVNRGPRDGFGFLEESAVTISWPAAPAQFGAALRQAFTACR
ncbi:MAG: hypothetical protein Tsb0020_33250 [Haliangiales bacterium]